MTDRTELRRLLDEATPGPWEAKTSEATMNDRSGWRIGHPRRPQAFFAVMRAADAQLIAAAVSALPLLDKLGIAEAHRDSLAAFLVEAQREKLAIVEAVRKLHREVEIEVLGPDCADETCDHEECPPVAFKACAHCYELGEAAHWDAFEDRGLEAVAWPCPTIRALDAGGVS